MSSFYQQPTSMEQCDNAITAERVQRELNAASHALLTSPLLWQAITWLVAVPFAIWCIFILIVVAVYNLRLYRNGTLRALSQLPAQRGLPFLGTALQYDIHQLHVWTHQLTVQKFGDLQNWQHYVPAMPLVVLNDPADIQFVLGKQQQLFTKGEAYERTLEWWCKGSMLLTEGSVWKQQRRTVQPLLQHKNLPEMERVIHRKLGQLMAIYDRQCNFGAESEVDVATLHAQFTIDVTGCIAFGVDLHALDKGDRRYVQASQAILRESWSRTSRPMRYLQGDMQRRGHEGVAVLDRAISHMIEQRKVHKRPANAGQPKDVLDELVTSSETDSKEQQQYYLSQIKLLMIAGSDTTSWWITTALYNLVRHPEALAKLQAELDAAFAEPFTASKLPTAEHVKQLPYLQAVLSETQRLSPSTPSIARKLREGSVTLPSGTVITSSMALAIVFYSIHRKKTLWGADAEQFRPERWLEDMSHINLASSYMPFSTGERTCAGQYLAKTEAAITLAVLCRQYEFKIAVGYENPPTINAISMLYTDGLKMSVQAR